MMYGKQQRRQYSPFERMGKVTKKGFVRDHLLRNTGEAEKVIDGWERMGVAQGCGTTVQQVDTGNL